MSIILTVTFYIVNTFLRVFKSKLFFKCIQQFIMVGQIVHELEILVRVPVGENWAELGGLRPLLQVLDQASYVRPVETLQYCGEIGAAVKVVPVIASLLHVAGPHGGVLHGVE